MNKQDPTSSSFQANRTILFSGMAVAIAMVVVTALATLWHLRQQAEIRTIVTAENIAKSMVLTLDGLIDEVDIALLTCADEINRQISHGNFDGSSINRFLLRQQDRLYAVAYLRGTNEKGEIVFGPGVESSPTDGSDRSDRGYFTRLRDDPNAGLVLPEPVFGRTVQKWVWPLSRRISKPDGTFGGVVFAGIYIDHFETMFAQIKMDSGGSIALREPNLGLIARHQNSGLNPFIIGESKVSTPFSVALKANPLSGSYVNKASIRDGVYRTHAYLRSIKYGFIVNVGVSGEAALAEWRKEAEIVIALVAAFIIALLAFSHLIMRSWLRQEKDMAALVASRESLCEAQKIASLGQYTYDLRADRWVSSDILDDIFGIGLNYRRDAQHWLDLVAADFQQDMRNHLKEVVEQSVPFDHEYRILRPSDGQERWVHGLGKLQFDNDGNAQILSGTIQDITERKRNEQLLAESESRLREIFNAVSDSIFIHDAETGKIVDVNNRVAEMYGYAYEEVLALQTEDLSAATPPFSMAEATGWIQRAVQDGPQTFDWMARHRDGHLFWVEVCLRFAFIGKERMILAVVRDISERKQAEEQIRYLAFFDGLTKLPNRRLLMDRLGHALITCARNKRKGGLLFVDLDDFKSLNDTYGHAEGDLLLQKVAQRLAGCVRNGDTVARLGGDEFVVMLEDLSENAHEAAAQTRIVGEKILAALGQPYILSSIEHRSTASIGAALFGDQRESMEELLKRVDIAMYQAKAAGRNTLRFFDPELQAAVKARAALEGDLRQGLREDQFLLYYQPQVDSGVLTGAEALIRWMHPERGLVSPGEFIPMAEETGLILPLGHWVLETACTQIATWAKRQETAYLTVAVNVSARQFHQSNFVDEVLGILNRTGVDPRKLKLELTESMLLNDLQDIIGKMDALKKWGVSFSLDDFGTGYSSLSYLKLLPLSQLKIDQSFVCDVLSDPNDAAISRTVVALAQSLGLSVIAEGVETEAQREFLESHGCHAYQGYLFGRAVTVEAFEELLKTRFRAELTVL
jgi:diguanylate cyclase (GGDEF)-like protein/PAS domain S-box-containing protein